MKNKRILQTISALVEDKSTEFIPVKDADMIYIDYSFVTGHLEEDYKMSQRIAKLFDTQVIFHFNGCDILVNAKSKMKDITKQYEYQSQIGYKNYVDQEFNKAVKNLNIKNAKMKTKEVFRLIKDKDGFGKYISTYQLNSLAQAFRNGYKKSLQDSYLDNKIEEVKKYIKK